MDEKNLSRCTAQLFHQVYSKSDFNNMRAKLTKTHDAIDANGKWVNDEKENSDCYEVQTWHSGMIRWLDPELVSLSPQAELVSCLTFKYLLYNIAQTTKKIYIHFAKPVYLG